MKNENTLDVKSRIDCPTSKVNRRAAKRSSGVLINFVDLYIFMFSHLLIGKQQPSIILAFLFNLSCAVNQKYKVAQK